MPLLASDSRSDRRPSWVSAPPSSTLTAAAQLLTPVRLAQVRTGLGVAMLTRPARLASALGVEPAAAARTSWIVQMLGAREIALGGGAWVALRRGDERSARRWVLAGLVADALDALVVARAAGRGHVRPAAGAAAVVVATTAVGVEAAALAERGEDGALRLPAARR